VQGNARYWTASIYMGEEEGREMQRERI